MMNDEELLSLNPWLSLKGRNEQTAGIRPHFTEETDFLIITICGQKGKRKHNVRPDDKHEI